jgi:3-carboxy-cis,cis-muconate cycloisomerase
MSYTPFQAPILGQLLGDQEIAAFFSVKADIEAMLRFEAALATAEAQCGVISSQACQAITKACETLEPDIAAIGSATARDGVAVPELVRQLRARVGKTHADKVHLGATSQDLIDTSMVLRLRQVNGAIAARLAGVIGRLDGLIAEHGEAKLMAHTRMQPALPVTVADRIDIWARPLRKHHQELEDARQDQYVIQFGGAVGTLDKLGDKAHAVTVELARNLRLYPTAPWHTDRSAMVRHAGRLSMICGALGKIGKDVALMAQPEVNQIVLSGSGGSSAIPDKQNPVAAEILETLARFNATLVGGMHHALIHEQERSGSAWTLEWMLMPQICIATGAACRTALAMLDSIQSMGK